MKILIICGDHKRNYNFIEHLQKLDNIKISKILLYSREEVVPVAPDNLNSNLKKLWQLHFEKRLEAENRRFNFNLSENFDEKEILKIKNVDEILSMKKEINKIKPDICFLSGIPILSKEILKILPKFTINLHLGIIPYYKGAITMFWPFLFLEPTMAGTTYHIVNNSIDAGEILHNNVPVLEKGDGMHDVAAKSIIEASKDVHLVVEHIKNRISREIIPKFDLSLESKGKLFYKSDWKPSMLKIIYELYDDKIVDLHLNKEIISKIPKLKKINN